MLDQKQLVWRCRRGVRELDVLFTRFLEVDYSDLKPTQQRDFQRLLEIQDPVIMDWLFGRYAADDDGLAEIISILRKGSGL